MKITQTFLFQQCQALREENERVQLQIIWLKRQLDKANLEIKWAEAVNSAILQWRRIMGR